MTMLRRARAIFNGFPYLVVRVVGALRHVTLLPADRPIAWLDDLAGRQTEFNRLDTALVLSPERAIFHAARGDVAQDSAAPRGGLFLTARLLAAEPISPTAELVRRASRLAVFLRHRQSAHGFVLGDLTRGARPATLEERVRLE